MSPSKFFKTAAVMLAVGGLSMGTVGTATAAEAGTLPGSTAGITAGSLPGTGSLPGMSFGSSGSLGESDTGSLGIGEDAPGMKVTQDGAKVRVKFEGMGLAGVLCGAVAVTPAGMLQLGSDPVGAVLSGKVGKVMSGIGLSFNTTMDPGVYFIVGACATKGDIAVHAIVTPEGPVGSVEGGLGSLGDTADVLIGSVEGALS